MTKTARIVLVTGASRGVGRAIALGLARLGFDLALNGIAAQADALKVTADEARLSGRRAVALHADVSDKVQVRSMVGAALAALGMVHAVVSNAGILRAADVEHCPEDYWDSVMDVNAKGTSLVVQALLPIMKAQGYGRICNTSPIGGKDGTQNRRITRRRKLRSWVSPAFWRKRSAPSASRRTASVPASS